jgi:hypothetical protein
VRTVEVCPACGYPVFGADLCFACRPSVAVNNPAPRVMPVSTSRPGSESTAQAG